VIIVIAKMIVTINVLMTFPFNIRYKHKRHYPLSKWVSYYTKSPQDHVGTTQHGIL